MIVEVWPPPPPGLAIITHHRSPYFRPAAKEVEGRSARRGANLRMPLVQVLCFVCCWAPYALHEAWYDPHTLFCNSAGNKLVQCIAICEVSQSQRRPGEGQRKFSMIMKLQSSRIFGCSSTFQMYQLYPCKLNLDTPSTVFKNLRDI